MAAREVKYGKVDQELDVLDEESTQPPAGDENGHPKEVPNQVSPHDPSRATILFGVLLYAFCSSTLLVINKVAMHLVPDAPFILFCQFLSSSLAVRGLMCARTDIDIEELNWGKVKPFALACLVFYLCLLCNTRALKSVNVETVIVARSCSPMAVVFLERLTLKNPLPTWKGLFMLSVIAMGATVYVVADKGFQIDGYAWLILYFIFIVIEMVFVKFVVSTVPMSTWTRVYYNNTLSIPMALVSALAMGHSAALTEVQWGLPAIGAVLLSCVVGVAISYAGFNLRKLLSATSFTVVGVVCKVFTVLINDLIWTQHSNAIGHLGLFVCIASGFIYEKVK